MRNPGRLLINPAVQVKNPAGDIPNVIAGVNNPAIGVRNRIFGVGNRDRYAGSGKERLSNPKNRPGDCSVVPVIMTKRKTREEYLSAFPSDGMKKLIQRQNLLFYYFFAVVSPEVWTKNCPNSFFFSSKPGVPVPALYVT